MMKPRTAAAVSRFFVRQSAARLRPTYSNKSLLYREHGSLATKLPCGRPSLANFTATGPWDNGVQTFGYSSDAATVVRNVQSTKPGHGGLTTAGNVSIALGSNVGDRLKNIEQACLAMDAEPDLKIVRTSALYETEAMYVEDQDRFLNAVCEVSRLNPRVRILVLVADRYRFQLSYDRWLFWIACRLLRNGSDARRRSTRDREISIWTFCCMAMSVWRVNV